MITPYTDIVTETEIGKVSKKSFNELVIHSTSENSKPSSNDDEQILLLAIDMQNDFMENGELGVPNSHKDVSNTTRFIYNNFNKISKVLISMDTHEPQQIFHPMWWKNQDGKHPSPYTLITAQDVEKAIWKTSDPSHYKVSLKYLIELEKQSKKKLCIWPYHCLEGTYGAAIECQFSNMIHFHSIVRKSDIIRVKKGMNKFTEMYGIIKPEIGNSNEINEELLTVIGQYDKIIIVGEAKSHCVLESLQQILVHFKGNRKKTENIIILEDCMSSINGFEEATEAEFLSLQQKYGIKISNSTECVI